MDKLPLEICDHICRYLGFDDLKALRLCSRKLCIAISPWLFREVVIYMNRESLAKARQISQTARLTGYVKALTIHCDYSSPMSDSSFQTTYQNFITDLYIEQAWNSDEMIKAREIVERTEPCPSWPGLGVLDYELEYELVQVVRPLVLLDKPRDGLQKAHQHYQSLAREAVQIQSTTSLKEIFTLLFSRCKNLVSIKVMLASDKKSVTMEHPSKEFQKGVMCPVGQPLGAKFGLYVMEQLVQAAQDAQRYDFENLQLAYISESILEWCAGALPLVFSNLTNLSWIFPYRGRRDRHNNHHWLSNGRISRPVYAMENRLHSVLVGQLNKLRSLKLVYPGASANIPSIGDLDLIVGTVVFPNLTNLWVNHVFFTSTNFSGFLLRHGHSLRSIQLEDVFIADGEWIDLLHGLKGKLPRLRYLELCGKLWQAKYWEAEAEIWTDFDNNAGLSRQISEFVKFDRIQWPLV